MKRQAIAPPWWTPIAAATWAVGHGSMTAYWALGGTVGLGLLSEGVREQSEAGGSFTLLLWGVVAAKAGAAVVALVLLRPRRWSTPLRRTLVLGAAVGGAGMTLYGLAGVLGGTAALLGLAGASDTEPTSTILWYVLLWSPLWLAGGLLFVATAWHGIVAGRGAAADVAVRPPQRT